MTSTDTQMQSSSIAAYCEKMYTLASKGGTRHFDSKGERESDEGYVFGWRTDTTTYTKLLPKHTIIAKHVESKTFSAGSDSASRSLSLEIKKGDKIVFEAKLDGSTRIDQFSGREENFVGTTVRDGSPWTITSGELTSELELLAGE